MRYQSSLHDWDAFRSFFKQERLPLFAVSNVLETAIIETPTEATTAWFNRSNNLLPWRIDASEPIKRLPMEQMDNSKSEF